MRLLSLKKIVVFLVLLQASSLYSQGLPIVGFGDPVNYTINTFAVPESSGLDLHWHGGIRFGDWTGSNVMKIENGNVGVGVLNPTSKFQVSNSFNTNTNEVIASFGRLANASGGSSIVRFGYHNTCDFEINSGYSNSGHRLGNYYDLNITNNHLGGEHGGINFATNSSVKMAINANGNVGIGINNPRYKLDVVGDTRVKVGDDKSAVGGLTIETYGGTTLKMGGNSTYSWIQSHMSLPLRINELGNNTIFNLAGGNVGIGTTNPDSKLTVAGNIHAQEVKVTVNAGVVPDYVFAKDYKLKSLEEVEAYIKQNKHLPEIPSASDVEKNGLMLADMNLNLLKKMEEMTLYMIEQNKEIINLKKENEILKSFSERLLKVESQLSKK